MVENCLTVFQMGGFDSEEQKRWQRLVAVRRTAFGSWVGGLGKFGVVFDSSGAEAWRWCTPVHQLCHPLHTTSVTLPRT